MFEKMMHRGWYFAADAAGSTGGAVAGDAGQAGGAADAGSGDAAADKLTFDTWFKDQPEDVQTLLDGHTKGLKTALESEREIRKTREKELRDLAKKAEEGSDAQKKLTELADREGDMGRRADFYEEAHAQGVTNLKLAFMVATQDELFDKKGAVDFDEMKKAYPELFAAKSSAAGNAGSGTGKTQTTATSMDDFIRRKAGS